MHRLSLIFAVLAVVGLAGVGLIGAASAEPAPAPDLGDLIKDLGIDQIVPDEDLEVGEEMCALPG